MDLRYETQRILQQNGYHATRDGECDWILFEDESLFGFAAVYDTVKELLISWEADQDSFLRKNSTRLRSFPAKAWNAYSIFLTSVSCSPENTAELMKIEEDFRGSRKIVRIDVTSLDVLFSALSPLLPIRNLVTLKDIDSKARLDSRLSFLKPEEFAALRKKDAESAIVDILLEET